MRFKKGISIQGFSNEMTLGLIVADSVYRNNNIEMWVTCGLDGKHSRTSLHYSGNAADLRIHNIGKSILSIIVEQLKEFLIDDFDVVLEETHIHLEYQPRYKTN